MATERESIDEVLIAALSAGMSHAQAAVLAGVSTKTVQRRHGDESFVIEIARRRARRVDELTGRLSELTQRALEAIEFCLEAGPLPARLRAAEVVFHLFGRLRAEVDVDTRLSHLERAAQGVATEVNGDSDPSEVTE